MPHFNCPCSPLFTFIVLIFDYYLECLVFYKALWLPQWECKTVPKKFCLDLCWEGNVETRPLATLIEYL